MKKKQKIRLEWNGRVFNIWIEEVTPLRAQELLGNLGRQRTIREGHVRQLAESIRRNHWDDLNGDALRFDSKGRLLDGQHRCKAVIKAEKSIVTFCIQGISPDAIFSVDQDLMRRYLRDILHMKEQRYTSDLAAALRWLYRFKMNLMATKGGSAKVDNRDAWTLFRKNPKMTEAVLFAAETEREFSLTRYMPRSGLAFLYYVLTHINKAKAISFLEQITYRGDAPEKDSPTATLRRRLSRASKPVRAADKISDTAKIAWTIKAWNLFVADKEAVHPRSIIFRFREKYPYIKDGRGRRFTYRDLQTKLS